MCRCNTNAFTHRRSYAETLYTQTFWHTDVFPHTHTHALALTHRRFYIQTLLHTDAFTHRGVYTEAVSRTEMHRNLYTRTLLRTYALTQQNLHKVLPGTTSYHCVRREEGARGGQQGGAKEGGGRPSTTCTTKFARNTSLHYKVCRKMPILSSTTLYCKVWTNYFQYHLLLRISKFAESISQYYTSYYKACAGSEKGREWARSNQYHFVLQSFHIRTYSYHETCRTYYKACTKFFPVRNLHEILPSTTSY